VKWNTKRTYDEILTKIDRELGERSVHAIKLEDFHSWYAEAKKPKLPGQPERITKAHHLMRMLRRLFSYGIMAGVQGCKRVHEILEQAQFNGAARRRTVLNFGYVQAFITEAIKSNRRSLALGTALQFETGMRRDLKGHDKDRGRCVPRLDALSSYTRPFAASACRSKSRSIHHR
jgi:hypothetical protein